jgi:ribosomal protein L37E
MATCERCWAQSYGARDQAEEYRRLLLVNDCTPEQQAGPEATRCPKCETLTCHQHTGQCIVCGEGGR